MRTYNIKVGQPAIVGVAGKTLRVVNDPFLYYLSPTNFPPGTPNANFFASGYLLIGFDRAPTPVQYDAIVPPFSQAMVRVPSSVGAVQLAFNGDPAGEYGSVVANQGIQVGVEWLDCEQPDQLIAVPMPPLVPVSGSTYGPWSDTAMGIWKPVPATPVLDQNYDGHGWKAMRPKIAPSVSDTIHQVTVANTPFNFVGAQTFLWPTRAPQGQVVQRIILSVSAAALVVIGDNGLTVGSPGADELVRVAFPAGGVQVIEFGEGRDIAANGVIGQWKCYASAAVTLDATVIGG